MAIKLFGFQLGRAEESARVTNEPDNKTFALPNNDDGAVTIQTGAYYGTYVDLDGVVRNEIELITRYRGMAMQAELENAIDEVVNDAIVADDAGKSVEVNMDDLKQPAAIKKKIQDEFEFILKLLDFGNMGSELFRRWYIDGRLFYHVIIDEKDPKKGIKEIRYIDPRRIRKIREVQKMKDPQTGMEIIRQQNEYYLYNERGVIGTHSNLGTKIAADSIINVNSGLMDEKRAMVLSYLHKAIKPLNQLRMVEDATVIYRLSRAPERRVFYVDVGNMPTVKANQYVQDIMNQYRNKLVYDSTTGEIRDDRRHLAMLEDFWLPRREGNRSSEIKTLEGGQNLGKMDDVEYFEKKLYKALGVPTSRLESQGGGGFLPGNATTMITREEEKFSKFITHLRNKFSTLFDELLRRQLSLKQICNVAEWKEFKEEIWYDYRKNSNITEIKDQELLTMRINLLTLVQPYVGIYYSQDWVRKNILQQTEEDIEEIDKQIAKEPLPPVMGPNGQMMPADQAAAMKAAESGDPATDPTQQQYVGPDGSTMNPDGTPEEPPPSKYETTPDEMEFTKK